MKTEKYLQVILSAVAEECGESVEDICSDNRRTELVRCRTMYCAIAWQLLNPVVLRLIAEPLGKCTTSVHMMILNHLKIKDGLYLAAHDRAKEKAGLACFKNFS